MTDAQSPKKRGCFFYGCITSMVLLLVVAVGVYMAYRFVIGKVDEYTDTEPMELPTLLLTQTELEELNERLSEFGDAVREGEATEPLVLQGEEINALVANEEEFRDHVYLTIEDDEVKGQISLPLDQLGFKGRYLNGAAGFRVVLQNGNLAVNVTAVEVKGKPFPEEFMQQLRAKNMAEGATEDPEVRAVLEKLESITVEDGKLTITPKAIPVPEEP
ncbi:MAG TPA: hypothetical protein VMS21_06205 [Methylomirabilota bacterium]|nr:hypothetical protein [Methylomirabilota bacterium]